MNAIAPESFSKRLPSAQEIENADQLRQIVANAMVDGEATVKVVTENGKAPQPITLTPAIAQTFLEVLRLISSGSGFMMIPVTAELTTQEAADLLNVSRPYFIKVLERGDIAYTTVGRHRRVKAEDLFAYKERRDKERAEALLEMAELDASMGLD